ncbi:MAG: radical SAM protein [Candidatus Njordarchaeota archaeon]
MSLEKYASRRKVLWIRREDNIPLVGCIAFGLIDRGTNTIQVRPTSLCPLSCIFCSTDAGPRSKRRQTEYLVELEYMIEVFREIVRYKGEYAIEVHIDTVGDPLTYPKIVDLVQELKSTKGVEVVSMQTHGVLLTEKILGDLSDAGLDRINLSIDALDPELAKYLSGTPEYDIEKITGLAEYIVNSTKMDLLIAPVWVPSINDAEIPKIIEFALKIGAGKKWPALGIQKYIPHKRGRKPKNIKPMTWKEFYKKLAAWETKYKTKLILSLSRDFGLHKRKMLPLKYNVGEKAIVKVVALGWLKNEVIAAGRNRSITVVRIPSEIPIGTELFVKIIQNKHNLYISKIA